MEIITIILPLYQELVKQNFTDFIKNTNFVRICNQVGISNEYAEANNKAIETAKKSSFGIFFTGMEDTQTLLAELLNKVYTSNKSIFADIICKLVIADLETASRLIVIENIEKDLVDLGLNPQNRQALNNAYQKYNSNDELKVRILISDLESHSTNGLADQDRYNRIRDVLLSKNNLKETLPHFLKEYHSLYDFRKFAQSLGGYAVRLEYIRHHFEPLVELVSKTGNNHVADAIVIDNTYIRITWQKAMDRMNEDPEGAITIARTLIETVCKHILDESGSTYDDGADLSVLYKNAGSILNLSPDQHTQPIFKQILSGCFSVVTGLGAIRNKISDAHGISEKRVRPSARHAGLAVNLSGSVCQFLLDSFRDQNKLPKAH